jgi:Mce-associated membrane protein
MTTQPDEVDSGVDSEVDTSITGEPLEPSPGGAERGPERTSRRGAVVTGLLVVAMLVCVAGAGWTARSVRAERAQDRADTAALAAGRDAAVAFTSYDYQRLDDDLARVAAMSTGTFKQQFSDALAALTDAIKAAEGVSEGRIVYAGLKSRRGDVAVVLVAANASITNNSSTETSTRRYRLQITLNRASGSWLISDIAPVA